MVACCPSLLLVARAVATYAVFNSKRQVIIVEDLSVQLIKCYEGQLHINIQDKATSVIVIVPNQ